MVFFSSATLDDEIRGGSAPAFGWSDICRENVHEEIIYLQPYSGNLNPSPSLQFSATAERELVPITRTSDKLASLTTNRWIRLIGLKPWTVCHLQSSRSGFWKWRHFHIRLKNPLCWCSLCWAWPFHFQTGARRYHSQGRALDGLLQDDVCFISWKTFEPIKITWMWL